MSAAGKPIGKNFFRPGDGNFISDISGQKFKLSESRMTWDNLLVHTSEWYPKHPQLTIRPRRERPPFRVARPRPASELE